MYVCVLFNSSSVVTALLLLVTFNVCFWLPYTKTNLVQKNFSSLVLVKEIRVFFYFKYNVSQICNVNNTQNLGQSEEL